jgi:PilZ domain
VKPETGTPENWSQNKNRCMSEDKTAGASYLAALKQMGAATGVARARIPAGLDSDARTLSDSRPAEKRRSPRYRCQGSANLREIRTGVATWATFTDVSLHGCYVEAMSAFSVGAELVIIIEVNGFRVECRGTVQVVYPGLGMGIAFTTMSDANRQRLQDLVRSLSQSSVILGARATLDRGSAFQLENSLPVKDPAAALRAISEFFEQRHMLDRDEFFRILRKSQQ